MSKQTHYMRWCQNLEKIYLGRSDESNCYAKGLPKTAILYCDSYDIPLWNLEIHHRFVFFTFVLCILILSKFYLFTNWCT